MLLSPSSLLGKAAFHDTISAVIISTVVSAKAGFISRRRTEIAVFWSRIEVANRHGWWWNSSSLSLNLVLIVVVVLVAISCLMVGGFSLFHFRFGLLVENYLALLERERATGAPRWYRVSLRWPLMDWGGTGKGAGKATLLEMMSGVICCNFLGKIWFALKVVLICAPKSSLHLNC